MTEQEEYDRLASIVILLWKHHPHVQFWYADNIIRLFDSLNQPAAELRFIWGRDFLNTVTLLH